MSNIKAQPTSKVMMSTMLGHARQVLVSQPFRVFLGVKITNFSLAIVGLRVSVQPKLLQHRAGTFKRCKAG
jgi:hypothetical protein